MGLGVCLENTRHVGTLPPVMRLIQSFQSYPSVRCAFGVNTPQPLILYCVGLLPSVSFADWHSRCPGMVLQPVCLGPWPAGCLAVGRHSFQVAGFKLMGDCLTTSWRALLIKARDACGVTPCLSRCSGLDLACSTTSCSLIQNCWPLLPDFIRPCHTGHSLGSGLHTAGLFPFPQACGSCLKAMD